MRTQAPDSIGDLRSLIGPDYDCGELPLCRISLVQNVREGVDPTKIDAKFKVARNSSAWFGTGCLLPGFVDHFPKGAISSFDLAIIGVASHVGGNALSVKVEHV